MLRVHRRGSVAETGLAELMLGDPEQGTVLPPREIAFGWWLRGLPASERVALLMTTRIGWVYDDVEADLLEQASVVLGCRPHEAPAAVTAALERRLGALPPEPATVTEGRARRRHRYAAAAVATVVLIGIASSAFAGAAPAPAPAPVEPAPAQLLPRPLARPIANYEDLAVVPGRQWDLPDRGERRSAPPWTR